MSAVITYKYSTFETSYLFKVKNENAITLKILDVSQKCLFKQHFSSQDFDIAAIYENSFETILQTLAEKKLIPLQHLRKPSKKVTEQVCEKAFQQGLEKTNPHILIENKDIELKLLQKLNELRQKVESLEKTIQPLKERAYRKEQERQDELKRQEEEALQEELERVRRAELMWFGKAKWETYFGDIGIEPPLPPNIHEILNAPCPFFPGKKVHKTHLLTLIPRTVNGKPFTLNTLSELIEKPQGGGKASRLNNYLFEIQEAYGDRAPQNSYWVLFTKDVIPGSREKKYYDQKQLLDTYNQKSHLTYQVPLVLEAVTSILMEHVKTGTRLYSNGPWTFTRSQERVSKWPLEVIDVGGFSKVSLYVGPHEDIEEEVYGLGACLRLNELSQKIESVQKTIQPLKERASRKERERQDKLKRQEEALQEELERARRAELELKRQEELSQMWFGKVRWAQYFGDIGVEPPLPPNIYDILNSPCVFFPGRRVHETHLLTLIPRTVNGKPFTINILSELIQQPQGGGKATKYEYYSDEIQREYGERAPQNSYWVLLTKDVIPGSRKKKYYDQKQLLDTYNQKSHLTYQVPLLLEAATSILMEHVQSGTRLYNDSPWTHTYCQERVSDYPYYPLIIGDFNAAGLAVRSSSDWILSLSGFQYDLESESKGLGACLKL